MIRQGERRTWQADRPIDGDSLSQLSRTAVLGARHWRTKPLRSGPRVGEIARGGNWWGCSDGHNRLSWTSLEAVTKEHAGNADAVRKLHPAERQDGIRQCNRKRGQGKEI